jgi:hypothetical protein
MISRILFYILRKLEYLYMVRTSQFVEVKAEWIKSNGDEENL